MLNGDDALNARLETTLARFHLSHRDAVRKACVGDDGRIYNLTYFGDKVIPIPPVVAATLDELPETIIRKCCPYKSCGNTQLLRQVEDRFVPAGDGLYRKVPSVSYVRDSNGEYKFGGDLSELLAQLNDPTEFPVRDGGIDDKWVVAWTSEVAQ